MSNLTYLWPQCTFLFVFHTAAAHYAVCNSPLPTDTIHQPVDTVACDAPMAHDLLGNCWVNSLEGSQSIALDLRDQVRLVMSQLLLLRTPLGLRVGAVRAFQIV